MLTGLPAKIRKLPTLPAILNQIIALLDEPNASPADIERVLKNDPALTGKLLATANSPYYGFQFEISTVRRAVVAVGYNEVRNLCMGLGLMGFLKPSVFRDRAMADSLWLHSLAVAQAAKIIARQIQDLDVEVAYTAGLLHDIGKVAMAAFFPDEVDGLKRLMEREGLSFAQAETRLGCEHGLVGALVAEHWKLPAMLSQVISRHHLVETGLEHGAMVATVHAADYLAHGLGFHDGYRLDRPGLDPRALAILGLDVEQFKECALAVSQSREQIDAMWQQMTRGAA